MLRLSRVIRINNPSLGEFAGRDSSRVRPMTKFEKLRQAASKNASPVPKAVPKPKKERQTEKNIFKGELKRTLDELFTHDYDPNEETLENITVDLKAMYDVKITTKDLSAWYEKQRKLYDLGPRINGQV